MRALMAAAGLVASLPLAAATLGGSLAYPGEELPAMTIVARDAAGATFTVRTRPQQRRYQLEVPAGTYVVFAIPLGADAMPGQPPLRGAHTAYSVCARDQAKLLAGGCRTGPLIEVSVAQRDAREDVDVDDWYLPDALMATLELAPFARFPADPAPMAATRAPDFDTAPALGRSARGRIQRAAVRGPFLAGRAAVARWECGRDCERWALVDMQSGRITMLEDKALQPVRRNFPCEAEPLEFREDSRLLRVHRLDGERVRTQDFLWSGGTLEKRGESAQDAAAFCRR